MIHHLDQRVTADAKRYHTWLYVKCTIIYDHICTQVWRSVSASGHGNLILKQLTRPSRVRFRPREGSGRAFWGKFELNNQHFEANLNQLIKVFGEMVNYLELYLNFDRTLLYILKIFSMSLLGLFRCQWENTYWAIGYFPGFKLSEPWILPF